MGIPKMIDKWIELVNWLFLLLILCYYQSSFIKGELEFGRSIYLVSDDDNLACALHDRDALDIHDNTNQSLFRQNRWNLHSVPLLLLSLVVLMLPQHQICHGKLHLSLLGWLGLMNFTFLFPYLKFKCNEFWPEWIKCTLTWKFLKYLQA